METKMKDYQDCLVPLEYRDQFPTRAHVEQIVRLVKSTGTEALWHGAVDHSGRPLYPSKIFPNDRKAADAEAFRYLVRRMHRIGRPVLSWYPVHKNATVAEVHPDWRMRFFDVPGIDLDAEKSKIYPCFNSPYGTLLPEFVAEAVRELGFDGFWFDGSYMGCEVNGRSLSVESEYPWPMFVPGCRCDFCRERFHRDTGLPLPDRLDFENRTFRLWMNWRYDVLMDLWKRLTGAITSVNPRAAVMFNNYRRRHAGAFHWTTAIPLRALNGDMGIGTEVDIFSGQVDFQIKMNRAYQCRQRPATHWVLLDHWNWGPDVETLPAVQATIGAMAAGGNIETGFSLVHREPLRDMVQAARDLEPYVDGEPVEYAAIHCSQQTQDFYGQANPRPTWDEWHGANEACRHGHVPSSIIFDDSLDADKLRRYPLILLGNAVCLSKQQAKALEQYVRAGGKLIATHQVGVLDELGYPHARPVLDSLLGIRSRRMVETPNPTLELRDKSLLTAAGKWVTFECWSWLCPKDRKIPAVLARPVKDVRVLADTWAIGYARSDPKDRIPGLWIRKVGKGTVAYCGINLFHSYLRAPTPHMLRFLIALMKKLTPPPLELLGPMCVTVNARMQQGGRLAVILHNEPGSAYRYPSPAECNYLHAVGEVTPVTNLKLKLHQGSIRSAQSAVCGKKLKLTDNQTAVDIPSLELYDIILLDIGRRSLSPRCRKGR